MTAARSFLENNLPSALSYLLKESEEPEELRLCLGAPVVLVTLKGKRYSPVICTQALLDDTIAKLTEYSFYSHAETAKEGYLSLPNGIRVGICGRAICQNGKIEAVRDFSFLSVRIPKMVKNIALPLFCKLKEGDFQEGALLYSLPRVGKTTVLKDLIRLLSGSGISLAVIDERGELSQGLSPIDAAIYRYYPKAEAITMAIKTASPQLLILDEISSKECNAILTAVACGVPVIATTHGRDEREILCRIGLDALFDHRIFQLLVGLTRKERTVQFQFSRPFKEGC